MGQAAGAALYHYAAQLDSNGRLVADDLVKINTGAMLYDEQMSYDPAGNVAAVTTILLAGTDNQMFCYDEQNRLTWAGTTTGNPCGNTGATGSFGGASYTQSFGYDTLNRLTSSPLGSYTYGDTNHLHAATSVSNGSSQYTASYDAAGDMQCRAPSSSTTCSGTPTGQQLTWDVEGRLSNWQNTTTSPTVTAKYLYDGEGNRVVQQVTDSTVGTTTTTSYVGSLETYSITTSSGPTGITTTDYIPAGKVLAESVNGTLSYLATSYQGSVVAALDSTGAVGVTASQLYAPYGGMRYASGTMPTDYGYTGQRADASTGLDYYGARYYDPTLGQFTSADTMIDGLNRYGYVGGNPTTATDPSGHMADSQVLTLMGSGEDTGLIAFGLAAIVALGSGAAIAALTRQSSASGADTAAALNADIAANTYTVAGASVYVTALGALVVTTGATVTSYAVGSAGWLSWNQQISATWTGDTAGAWNTGRVRTWVATHPETSKTSPDEITKTTTGGGHPGEAPGGLGVQIPATPPIGIAIGIGIGITSLDTGGPLSIKWWRGLLFAKKTDLKQLRAAARQAGIKDEEDIREFGDWLEGEKQRTGLPPNYHTTFKELVEWAKEWLELYGKGSGNP